MYFRSTVQIHLGQLNYANLVNSPLDPYVASIHRSDFQSKKH